MALAATQKIVTVSGRGEAGAAKALETALASLDDARIVTLSTSVNRVTSFGRCTIVAVVEHGMRP